MKSRNWLQASVLATGIFFCVYIQADSASWLSTPADSIWTNPANWTDPVPNAAGEVAAFAGYPGTSTIDSGADITIGSLVLNVPGNTLTIGFTSNTLTFNNSGSQSTIFNAANQTHFIDTEVILNNDLAVVAGASASLTFSQEVSGSGGFIAMADDGTHIQFNAENTYLGTTIVESGTLQLNGPVDANNVPGNITVMGSGTVEHDPAAGNNYADGSVMTLDSGQMLLRGTTQTLDSIVMTQGAGISGPAGSQLNLSSAGVALSMSGDSAVFIDRIVLVAGGTITNNSSNPGAGFFLGDFTDPGFLTIDLDGNNLVRINADNNPQEGNNEFDLDFFDVQFVNGTLEKSGAGEILLEGSQGKIVDLDIINGVVQIGRADGFPSLIDGPATVTITQATLRGFGTLGTSGNVTVINDAGGNVIVGGLFAFGNLTISGNYQQNSGGSLFIQGFDTAALTNRLFVDTGGVSLDGNFFFISFPGAQFVAGDEVVVIDNTGGTGITGTFSNEVFEVPSGLTASLVYSPTQVRVRFEECGPSDSVLPPTNLRGEQLTNIFATQTDVINQLTWDPSSTITVVSYNVYRNEQLIGTVSASGPLVFEDHNRKFRQPYQYGVTSVDNAGTESAPIVITFPL